MPKNQQGHCAVDAPTILFMPHCDLTLYENILAANWSIERLSNILLVSNDLSDYIHNNPTHKLEGEAPCLLKLAEFLECHPLPLSETWPTAFNNTAIQFIPPSSHQEKESALVEILRHHPSIRQRPVSPNETSEELQN